MKGMKLRKFLCLVLAAVIAFGGILIPGTKASAAETPTYRNVMYYGDWSIYAGQKNFYPSKMDGSLITHLNFAFMDVDKSGNLVLCDEHADFQAILPEQNGLTYGEPYAGVLGAMSILRAKYPNMKIGISVGGWTRSGDFPAMAANASARKNFAQNISKFVDYLGFDFVDIDWEYPCDVREPDAAGNGVSIDKGCAGTPEDGRNFTLLMQDIRAELNKLDEKNGKHYELSAAMSASPAKMAVIDYAAVLNTVDFLNMMTYDLNGAWNSYSAHQTALYTNEAYDHENQIDGAFSVDSCIQYLEDNYGSSIDYSKIVIGVTSYTRGWAGVKNDGPDASCPGLYATATPNSVKAPDGVYSGTFAYSDLNTLISQYQLKEYWDDSAKAAYFYSEDTGYFFTCDTPRSIAEKGNYVKEKGLGGLICWMASQDADGTITRAMKEALYGSAALPTYEIITASPDVSVSITATDSTTYTLTIKNNEKSVESNTALKDAELFQKTVMMPKLYIETKSGTTFKAGSESGNVTNQNGVGVIDLSGVYAAKALKPGGSHTFTIRVSETDISDIVSITMTQRILASMEEFGAQVVYGEGGEEPTIPTDPKPTDPEPTDPKPTDPKPTDPKPTDPKPTDPKPTDPEPTDPKPTDPKPTDPKPTDPKPTDPEPTDPKPTDPKPTDPEPSDEGTWEASKVYVSGDTVTYNGKEYKAKWWTMGEKPGSSAVWEEISGGTSQPGGSDEWNAGKVYVGGDTVTYGGNEYKAKWWTQGDKPGENMVWELISGTPVEPTDPEPTDPKPTDPEPTDPKPTDPEPTDPKPTDPEPTDPKPTDPKPTDPKPTDPKPSEPVSSVLPDHLVTGYWHNFCNGSTNLKLSDVPDCYDMICVAFTGNSSIPGEATFELDKDLCTAVGGYTKEEFIQDIKDLQAKGKHVIISVGGAEGRISITSDAAAETFAQSMTAIIEEYGFEGVDVDLEGGAVAGTSYIAGALRKLHNHFGDDFIITMAPETAYVQNAQGSYLKLALEIKDILTICYPQFYNSGTMIGYDGMAVHPGTADFITSQLTTIVEAGLRPDQVGIGLPCVPSAAGSGYIGNDVIEKAVTAFVTGTKADRFIAPQAYPGLRSMMTWSINWDATNGYAWGKAMSDLMDRVDTMEAPVEPAEPSGETTWDASAVYVGGDTVLYNGKTYRAKWWTQGDCPANAGSASPWERIG